MIRQRSESVMDADLKPVKQETEEYLVKTEINTELILKEPNSVVQFDNVHVSTSGKKKV